MAGLCFDELRLGGIRYSAFWGRILVLLDLGVLDIAVLAPWLGDHKSATVSEAT